GIRVGRVMGGVAAAEALGGHGEHTVVAGVDGDRCRVPAGRHVAADVPPRGAPVEYSDGVVTRERNVGAGGPVVRDRVRGRAGGLSRRSVEGDIDGRGERAVRVHVDDGDLVAVGVRHHDLAAVGTDGEAGGMVTDEGGRALGPVVGAVGVGGDELAGALGGDV